MEDLIKKLAETWGPPGFEHWIREAIRAEVEPLADEVSVDPLGNLICRLGTGEKRVMVAAHMDEIGLIVSHIDRQGFARFSSMGTLFPATLLGARVLFENGVIGTIGVDHQYSKRRELPAVDGFYLDISQDASSNADVKVGDPGALLGTVITRGERLIGKSLDDRLGCAVQIEAMRRLQQTGTPHSLYFVFTVQEEVGSRGAQTAAYGIEPHFGLAIDVSPAGDVPHGRQTSVALGAGPVIKSRDTSHIVPAAVRDLLIRRAAENHIPYQLEVFDQGSTDGRVIQVAKSGVPTGGLLIPVRYTHTASETADWSDVRGAVDLLTAVLHGPLDL